MGPSSPDKICGLNRNIFFTAIVSFFMDFSLEMVYPLVPLFLSSVLGVQKSVIGLIEGTSQARKMLTINKQSNLESSPSRHRTPVISGAINATGKSLFILLRGLWIPEITSAIARIKDRFTTLLPRASPRAI